MGDKEVLTGHSNIVGRRAAVGSVAVQSLEESFTMDSAWKSASAFVRKEKQQFQL